MTNPPTPDDQVVPWTPRHVAQHVRVLRDHLRDHPDTTTADQALHLVAVLLDWTACPHEDCPHLLLDGEH